MVSINELVDAMTEQGYKVTPRTIKYYIEKGLLPQPEKQGGYKEGVRLSFDDGEKILSKLKAIFEYKGKGYKLSEIKEVFEKEKELEAIKERKEVLDSFVEIDGFFHRKLRTYTPGVYYISAKDTKNFVSQFNNNTPDWHEGIQPFDYDEIDNRHLYIPQYIYDGVYCWEKPIDASGIQAWGVLNKEYDLGWDILELMRRKHEKNLELYYPLPENDGLRFSEKWSAWKIQGEANTLSTELIDYIGHIKEDAFQSIYPRNFVGPNWHSAYESVDIFIDDFLSGKCVFLPHPILTDGYFLKRCHK